MVKTGIWGACLPCMAQCTLAVLRGFSGQRFVLHSVSAPLKQLKIKAKVGAAVTKHQNKSGSDGKLILGVLYHHLRLKCDVRM